MCATASSAARLPIYTKVRDEVPTHYGNHAEIADCVVADALPPLRQDGKTRVVFREVMVEEGAEVRDSIVMQGSTIERGASIQYTILDKNVTVRSGTRLSGSPSTR